MSDVDPGSETERERAENATGTDVLTLEQMDLGGYVTEEGVVAGLFWWNDPGYPANGDLADLTRQRDEAVANAPVPWGGNEQAPVGELEA
jgi:hypothetical protein